MKRIPSLFTLLALFTSLSVNAEILNGSCGKDGNHLIWTFNTENGLLNIEGSGEMANYDDDTDAPWYSEHASILKISLPDGITRIGSNAFIQCSGLTSITIPTSVTDIGESAFWFCEGLTEVTIPSSVTNIEKLAFAKCKELQSVTLPTSITEIGESVFEDCTSLTSISIPESVTHIGEGAFRGCNSLTSIALPNSITYLGRSAFSSCENLSSIHLPHSITSIEPFTFDDCKSLTSITLPASITTIGSCAFSGCTGLTSFSIPDSITSIGVKAFSFCSGLTSIHIPESVTSIGESAFSGCSGLRSVTIPTSVTDIEGYAFYLCSKLTSATIPSSVKKIGNSAFYFCSDVTSVTIPHSVTSISSTSFIGCSKVKSLFYNSFLQPDFQCEELYIGDSISVISTGFNNALLRKVVLGKNIELIEAKAFSNAHIEAFTLTGEEPPATESGIFGTQNLANATLYVPEGKVDVYQTLAPWNQFGKIVAADSHVSTDPTFCEVPTITYTGSSIKFSCATKGAMIHYTITPADFRQGVTASDSIPLSGLYQVTAYAMAEGKKQSETASLQIKCAANVVEVHDTLYIYDDSKTNIQLPTGATITLLVKDGDIFIENAPLNSLISIYTVKAKCMRLPG